MSKGVYVKPNSASVVDFGYGGGGFAGGGAGRSAIGRPVSGGLGGAYRPPPSQPYSRPSNFQNANSFNNRSTAQRGFSPQARPQTTPARPFQQQPSRPGRRGTGFQQLLREPGRSPQRNPTGGRGFGPSASNAPKPPAPAPAQTRPAPRPIPVDTPTAGAKRPFNFRRPASRIPVPSLPGNPFALAPRPFLPSGADELPPITYPNELPIAGLAPGFETAPGNDAVFWPADLAFGVHIAQSPRKICGKLLNPGIFINVSGSIYATGMAQFQTSPSGPIQTIEVLTNDRYWGHQNSIFGNNNQGYAGPNCFGQDYSSPGSPPQTLPNPSRPASPQPIAEPLPSAVPTGQPTAPPLPNFDRPPQPWQQPLPYPSPDPVPLQPGDGDLPEELRPPQPSTAPGDSPGTSPGDSPSTAPGDSPGTSTSPRPGTAPGTSPGTSPLGNSTTGRPFRRPGSISTGNRTPALQRGANLENTTQAQLNPTDAEIVKRLLTNPPTLEVNVRPPYIPVTGITNQTGITTNIQTPPPYIPNKPPTEVEKCQPDPESKCKYDNKDIAGKCEKIQALLDKNLDVNYTASIELLPCEEEEGAETINLSSDDTGIPGIDAKLNVLAEALNLIWAKVKCDTTPLISICDTWEIKKELNTGQLVIVTKKPDDKSSYRRNFSIPHPRITTQDAAKSIFTTRRRYERGNHLVTLLLRDNSRIRLNVDNDSTGQSLMDWLVDNCLDLSYQETPPGQYRHTGNAGRDIISCEVEFYSVAYYPTGKKGEMPSWQFVIPK